MSSDAWTLDETEYKRQSTITDRIKYLLRYGIMAPSSHNTQPWIFRVHHDALDVMMDQTRWLKVADADQRELHVSIGCALENLLVAAEHFELCHDLAYFPNPDDPMHAATIRFDDRSPVVKQRPDSLLPMISIRHTNHNEYDNRPISEELLARFQALCNEPGITLYLTDDLEIKRKVDTLLVQADALAFADPNYREELGYWIGEGVFGTSWLMSKVGKLAVTYINMAASQAKKDSSILMSSPILALLSSETDDRISQIKVGQIYQRLSLFAASLGIWCHPISQLLEISEVKSEITKLQANPALIPQHPFRMGYANPERYRTPRRALSEVIVSNYSGDPRR